MTTDGNFDFIEREMADKKAEEYRRTGNYLPDTPPRKGWRKIHNIKLTLWAIALTVVDTGMILYWMKGAA